MLVMFSQIDSKYTEGSTGKEEKQEATIGSIFKVVKLEKFFNFHSPHNSMPCDAMKEFPQNNGIWLHRRLGEPAAMERQDSQEGLRVTLAEMEKVNLMVLPILCSAAAEGR